jgi:DNA-binding MarR family transcriptional regulator
MEYIREIFFRMFMITRKWELVFNRDHKVLTLKQLMFLIVVKNAFQEDPTIKDVAEVLSTSHQNVKAIAMQLEKKGFISIYKDTQDRRVTRVQISDERQAYWEDQNKVDTKSLLALFSGIDTQDLITTLKTLQKLDRNVDQQI